MDTHLRQGRDRALRRTISALMLSGLCLGVATPARAISGYRILQKLKVVDGERSGLDADTVRGMTPDEISADAAAGAAGAVGRLLASAYSRVAVVELESGFCNAVDVACDEGDFLLNCGGMVDPAAGYLTQAGEILDMRVCRAGGCVLSGPSGVAATATCLRP
jgi:hypothetical protein